MFEFVKRVMMRQSEERNGLETLGFRERGLYRFKRLF